MVKESTHFAISGNDEKLPAGPTMLPKPGPTLVMQATVAVNAVIKSRSRDDNIAELTNKVTISKNKYTNTPVVKSGLITRLL